MSVCKRNREKLKKAIKLIVIAVASMFSACGDDSDNSSKTNDDDGREVATLAEMGRCTSEREGDTVYVAEKLTDYLCKNKSWMDLSEISDGNKAQSSSSAVKDSSFTKSDSDLNMSSSSDADSAQGYIRENISVTGVAQKGPFKFGSPLTLYELKRDLSPSGRVYIDEINSNKGDFVIPKVSLVSPYAKLEVRGLYRNELTGEWSTDSMVLQALTDFSDKRTEVNINLLTHLEYDRALYLVQEKGYSVYAAKKQAAQEIMTAFEFATAVTYSEDFAIFQNEGVSAGTIAGNASLLAISVLFMANRNDAEIQDAIDKFVADIKTDGEWNDLLTKTDMADWAHDFDYDTIRASVKSWNILDIPNYENYLTIFWNNAYELGGCDSTRISVVLKNKNKKSRNYNVHYICKTIGWQKATDYEKDTYQWVGGKEGDVKKGNVTPTYYTFENGVWVVARNENVLGLCNSKRVGELAKVDTTYFICRNERWNRATALEYDTYEFGAGKDGEVRVGKVNFDQYYVYENGSWRTVISTIEKDLGACVKSREREIGKSSNTYYICKSKNWSTATVLEYDTYGWKAGTEGEVKAGNVSVGRYYVYENGAWRASASGLESNLGGCVASREGEIGQAYETYYICKSKAWIEATVLEYDTYGWTSPKEGEVKSGNVNMSIFYIFKNGKWTEASILEYDTYGWSAGTEGEVKPGNVNTSIFYVFENSGWRVANAIEKDLGGCVASREGVVGKSGDTYYICASRNWTIATIVEYDTYGWSAGTEGEVKPGNVNKSIFYVFENGRWRMSAGKIENDLGGCVESREGEIGISGRTYYICKSQNWMTATVYEYDTYGWTAGKKGEVRAGNINASNYYIYKDNSWQVANRLEYDTYGKTCQRDGSIVDGNVTSTKYVCDADSFRYASPNEVFLNMGCTNYTTAKNITRRKNDSVDTVYICSTEDGLWYSSEDEKTYTTNIFFKILVTYGSFVDSRDKHTYRTISLERGYYKQTWMAENLNYDYNKGSAKSYCYNDSIENCDKYGRLYRYSAAMDSAGIFTSNSAGCGWEGNCSPVYPVRGVCPSGWHLPGGEWDILAKDILGWAYMNSRLDRILKSKNDWRDGYDAVGFSALPAGLYSKKYDNKGRIAAFWDADHRSNPPKQFRLSVEYSDYSLLNANVTKEQAVSVRCVKD
jgi:uncharacterized protein (TIGR02145 family)